MKSIFHATQSNQNEQKKQNIMVNRVEGAKSLFEAAKSFCHQARVFCLSVFTEQSHSDSTQGSNQAKKWGGGGWFSDF